MATTPKKTQRMRASLPEDLSIVYTEETELHWQRIMTALLIVLALLTTMGWILMNSISAEKAAEVISSKPEPEEVAGDGEDPASAEAEPRIQQLDKAIPQAPSFNETLSRGPRDKPQTTVPTPLDKMLPLYAHMPDVPVAPEAPQLVESKFLAEPQTKDIVQVTRNPFYIGSLQLTSALENKNPTDLLDAEITLGNQRLVKVYAYSELTNLKGERVYHDWYKGNKRMARIPVGVYLDDMRASTSKYIDQTMVGDWHMEVTRPNGERLGRMDFRVNADS